MAKVRKGARKSLSESELEDWIESKEADFGPLEDIDVSKTGTVGTFEDDLDTPDDRAKIILDPEGAASCPDGKSEVCRGPAYISGVKQKVLICR
jgi:hypothetical protein